MVNRNRQTESGEQEQTDRHRGWRTGTDRDWRTGTDRQSGEQEQTGTEWRTGTDRQAECGEQEQTDRQTGRTGKDRQTDRVAYTNRQTDREGEQEQTDREGEQEQTDRRRVANRNRQARRQIESGEQEQTDREGRTGTDREWRTGTDRQREWRTGTTLLPSSAVRRLWCVNVCQARKTVHGRCGRRPQPTHTAASTRGALSPYTLSHTEVTGGCGGGGGGGGRDALTEYRDRKRDRDGHRERINTSIYLPAIIARSTVQLKGGGGWQ